MNQDLKNQKKMTTMMINPTAKLPKNKWFEIKAGIASNEADIIIFDEIGGWGITAKDFSRELSNLGNINTIHVDLHSPGGDVFEGIAIYNLLSSHVARVVITICGLAASMGSVVAMAGDEIIMPENAMMMIHKPCGWQGGEAEDMRKYADLLDTVESALVSSYAKKTGLPNDEIHTLLAAETWMTGKEAVEKGFADRTTEPLQMAAHLNSKRMKDFKNMPEKMKALIAPKAILPKTPANTLTAEEQAAQITALVVAALAQQNNQETPNTPTAETEDQIRARITAEMVQRQTDINGVFANFKDCDALKNECLTDLNITADIAKNKLLAKLGKNISPANTFNHGHVSNGNLVGDSVRASVLARAGFEVIQADNPYNHMSLRELARASLSDRNILDTSHNPMQMVGLAFTHTSSDFGNILIDIAHKSLLTGWDEAEETFDQWTKKGQLSDFKTAKRVGMESMPTLRQVRDGAEYKYVTTGDKGEPIALATYGEIFSITRQTIINDDLQALMDIPSAMGRAAKATIGDLVYAVLTSNPKLSDNVDLFHATHKNLATGVITVDNLDKARQFMRKQKSGNRHLNIRPAYMLVPTALEALSSQTIKSVSVKGTDVNSGISNPVQNFAEVIAEPRLDDDSAIKWYLAAAKNRDTIEVAYLNGIDTPYIDQQEGFTTDGVATKVRIDAGVSALDFKGLVRSSGT